jgi:microcystin-dependent protein
LIDLRVFGYFLSDGCSCCSFSFMLALQRLGEQSMTQPFLGQIQSFGFGFAPRGWALCNGQILAIAQNTALFSLLGTTYGGNGQTTFALPNLQSRVPVHKGTLAGGPDFLQGEESGVETVTLNLAQIPAHTHTFAGTSANANGRAPLDGSAFAKSVPSATNGYYATAAASLTTINVGTLAPYAGGGQPHQNLQPYLTISWCIAMQGVFPARN